MAALALLAAVSLCSPPGPARVAPPPDQRADRNVCYALRNALPDELAGRDRRDTQPSSNRTAAWGSPDAVTLRCGVARPAGLTETSQVTEVEGVDWFLVERPAAYVFTTVGRTTHVEVRVPRSTPRAEATAALVDLADALTSAVPLGD